MNYNLRFGPALGQLVSLEVMYDELFVILKTILKLQHCASPNVHFVHGTNSSSHDFIQLLCLDYAWKAPVQIFLL